MKCDSIPSLSFQNPLHDATYIYLKSQPITKRLIHTFEKYCTCSAHKSAQDKRNHSMQSVASYVTHTNMHTHTHSSCGTLLCLIIFNDLFGWIYYVVRDTMLGHDLTQ